MVEAIFTSLVDLSDQGELLERFLGLPAPRMFMHGEQNNSLPCLPALEEGGVERAEISHCAHVTRGEAVRAAVDARSSGSGGRLK